MKLKGENKSGGLCGDHELCYYNHWIVLNGKKYTQSSLETMGGSLYKNMYSSYFDL